MTAHGRDRPLLTGLAGVRLSVATLSRVKRDARESGRSVSNVLRIYIEAGIEAGDKRAARINAIAHEVAASQPAYGGYDEVSV